jgi:nuclease-like protein
VIKTIKQKIARADIDDVNVGRGVAGKGTRELAYARFASRQKYIPILSLCIVAIVVLVIASFEPGASICCLFLAGIILMAIKEIGRLIDQNAKQERRAVQSAQGEELIGKILGKLGENDYAVFHDLASPFGKIDHLVLSKERGLFLIETKARGGRVSIVNAELKINQRKPEKDFIAQTLRNTLWLGQQLEARLSAKVWIHPILVFSNAYVEKCDSIRNIRIIPKLFLLETIRRQSNSREALKLWDNKEMLAEIFPSIWFPPKPDATPAPTQPSQPPLPQDKNAVSPIPSVSNGRIVLRRSIHKPKTRYVYRFRPAS